MKNQFVADTLYMIADLLDLKGEMFFKTRAYRIAAQTIEALEREDFSRIAAPMYAKGFIKLYAEYLGLDAAPLIREYTDLHAPKVRPPLAPEKGSHTGEHATKQKKANIDLSRLVSLMNKWKRPISIGAGVIALFVMVMSGINRCSRRMIESQGVVTPSTEKKVILPVIRDPPEPYIETSSSALKTP